MNWSRAKILLCVALALPAAASAKSPAFGPPIPGVCLFAKKYAMTQSPAARAVEDRIAGAERALADAVARQAAVFAQQKQELARQKTTLGAIEYDRRVTVLQQQEASAAIVSQQQHHRLESEAARARAGLEQRMADALAQVVSTKRCSLIVERDATYGWNNQMDITTAVSALIAM